MLADVYCGSIFTEYGCCSPHVSEMQGKYEPRALMRKYRVPFIRFEISPQSDYLLFC
jgi:uncharacterized protein YchJ